MTPANYKLPYRTNGLTAYVITHVIFAIVCVIPSTRAWLGTSHANPLANNWCTPPLPPSPPASLPFRSFRCNLAIFFLVVPSA